MGCWQGIFRDDYCNLYCLEYKRCDMFLQAQMLIPHLLYMYSLFLSFHVVGLHASPKYFIFIACTLDCFHIQISDPYSHNGFKIIFLRLCMIRNIFAFSFIYPFIFFYGDLTFSRYLKNLSLPFCQS